jgi:UDP-N-acetylglucosamine--N-acetylmuramyl-(pentapeptide) pyrophosphoryl-undecaprenol N-acetylglucosamine transferase
MRILFVCDRSGGHIFPALTLAEKIKQKFADKYEIYFFATSGFLKKKLEEEGFRTCARPFKSRNLILEISYRFLEALFIILWLRPRKIIGFGGRDSFFLIIFGCFFFRDVSIYEPNVTMGKANKILSLFARRIFCGFREFGSGKKYIKIGIPLRPNIKKIEKKEALASLAFDDKPTVLCFGGSQGSLFLNGVFTRFVDATKGDFQVIHLTGEQEYFKISQFYNKIDRKAFVKDFYYPMETLYSVADLVICRAGASSLAELAYYKLASILIPLPAAGGHQKQNAFYFKERGVCCVFLQDNFKFEEFSFCAAKLLFDAGLRQTLRNKFDNINLTVDFEKWTNLYQG